MNKSIESKCDVCFINDKCRGSNECVFCRLSRIEKENEELNELRANYLETLILRDKEIDCLKQTVSQRNIQIADLKHRLNGQPITTPKGLRIKGKEKRK